MTSVSTLRRGLLIADTLAVVHWQRPGRAAVDLQRHAQRLWRGAQAVDPFAARHHARQVDLHRHGGALAGLQDGEAAGAELGGIGHDQFGAAAALRALLGVDQGLWVGITRRCRPGLAGLAA